MKPKKPIRSATPRAAGVAIAILLSGTAASGQEAPQGSPVGALRDVIVAACRQDEAQFARYLTSENAAAFRELPAGQRAALMKRFSLLDAPGRPLLSTEARGREVVRCEASSVTSETRLGEARVRENLAFVLIESVTARRHVEIGLVREGSGWKLLSVGLLLLDLKQLSQQWAAADLEARESAAIAALRGIASALGTYRRAFGRLPESLAKLGPAPKEGISPEAASLVDAELAAGNKGGYVFRYRILPAVGEGAEVGFELAATPIEYPTTGQRSFFTDSSGTLRGADKQGAVATAADPRIESK